MKVSVKDTLSGNLIAAEIKAARLADMPLKKDGWQFNWRELCKKSGATFFKLTLENSAQKVEGMLMLTLQDGGMLYMDCLEVAPKNYGSKGQLDFVAGCLLAYACKLSKEIGKPPYDGYLSFESKTVLIEMYQKKYGATWAMGQRMFFSPAAGIKLMELFLQSSEND
ncbi:MAG: hypothetical protein HY842_03445 [Bacteroidetes bacterium]|nr:hypothetical protein [Bacteroidota bacterium]